jgi:hypothetical protein
LRNHGPKTGYFRFWITAPDDAQLWLADGSIKRPGDSLGLFSRFGKRKIASVWGTGYFTSRAARYSANTKWEQIPPTPTYGLVRLSRPSSVHNRLLPKQS